MEYVLGGIGLSPLGGGIIDSSRKDFLSSRGGVGVTLRKVKYEYLLNVVFNSKFHDKLVIHIAK